MNTEMFLEEIKIPISMWYNFPGLRNTKKSREVLCLHKVGI